MPKMLIIAADAVTPEIYMRNPVRYKNIANIMSDGAYAFYGAYAGRGYKYSYTTDQNWASIYTGRSPDVHRISSGIVADEKRKVLMSDFDAFDPLWKVMNENGLTVGLWAGYNLRKPIAVDGYVISSVYTSKELPDDSRYRERTLQFSPGAEHLRACLEGEPPPRVYPLTLEQRGYRFSDLLNDAKLAERVISEYNFSESIGNFEAELDYFANGIKNAEMIEPVDVIWFYTPSTDLISHFGLCGKYDDTLLKSYDILDAFIGNICRAIKPEITVFMSDHGQKNFGELVKSKDLSIQEEAFGSRDTALFFHDGYIATLARNGSLLFTTHSPLGCFAACGSGIRHTEIENMRTLDIYPTLLAMLGITVAQNSTGYAQNIFHGNVATGKMTASDSGCTKIAIIQNHSVEVTSIVVNELYLEKRFSKISVAGEKRYEEIFRNNPRVFDFVSTERFVHDDFDEVYCVSYNENDGTVKHIKVK